MAEQVVKGAITLDFSGVSDAPASGARWLKEAGKYVVKVEKITKHDSNNSEYPYFKWLLVVVGGTYNGAQVEHYTSLNPAALFNLRNTIMAIVGKEVPKQAVKIDFSAMVGKKLGIEVAMEPGKNDPSKSFAKVVATFGANKVKAAEEAVFGSDDDDLLDEEALG